MCSCHPGYQLAVGPESIVHCQPVCSGDCTNGICTEPDVCVCLPGYVETLEGQCEPYCEEACGKGAYCAQPNVCACPKGLSIDENGDCRHEVGADLFIRSRFADVEDDEDDDDEEEEEEKEDEPLNCPDGFRAVPATGECICDSGAIAEDGTCIDLAPVERVKLFEAPMQQLVVADGSESQGVTNNENTTAQAEPIQLAGSSLLAGIDRDDWIIIAAVIAASVVIVTASVVACKYFKKRNSMETDIQ